MRYGLSNATAGGWFEHAEAIASTVISINREPLRLRAIRGAIYRGACGTIS